MKKLLLIISIFFLSTHLSFGQITERTSGYSYVGLGYSLVGFTDAVTSDMYPFLDFRNGNFMTDINLFVGHRPVDEFAFEFSPSIIFTSGIDRPGYNYVENGVTKFHVPRDVSLFMIPINVNGKFFPFAKNSTSILSSAYVVMGGGITYIREQYTNFVYSSSFNNTPGAFERSETYKESVWVPNFETGIGFMSTGVFGYGFEVNYRFVFTDQDFATPLALSRASNFNSLNLSLKAVFIF